MPTKQTEQGRTYEVDGKRFTWHPLDDDDLTGTLPDVVIPLRIKLGVIRRMNDRDLDAGAMFEILGTLVPGQADALDEMDLNDFQVMFSTWQREYQALAGATLGESGGSSA